jgi:hypothetical protein
MKKALAGLMAVGLVASASMAAAQESGPSVRSAAYRTLGRGTTVQATLQGDISSQHNKIGDMIDATITNDVRDANGQVIFPAGSSAKVQILDIKAADKSHKDGTLAMQVSTVNAGGATYQINSSVGDVSRTAKKPGWTSDKKKIGIGAAAGAILGGVVGGSLKGAVIGGILGAGGGAVVAHEMNGADFVVKQGTTVTFQLQRPVTVLVT